MKVFFQIKFSITAKEETQIEEELGGCSIALALIAAEFSSF